MMSIELSDGTCMVHVSETGVPLIVRSGSIELLPASPPSLLGELFFGTGKGKERCAISGGRLLHRSGSSAEFEATTNFATVTSIRFTYEVKGDHLRGSAFLCTVRLLSDSRIDTPVQLVWYSWFRLDKVHKTLFAPMFDGRGLTSSRTTGSAWYYQCAGGWGEEGGERLALPCVDEGGADGSGRLTFLADPYFSTGIVLPSSGPAAFRCTFLPEAGHKQFPERTFGLVLHSGGAHNALDGFFRYALPDCPPGPRWIHDIAMVHYDFMSDRGDGWFRDIDTLLRLLPPEDRKRVALTLHGWYDCLGRYCFDESRGALDREWTIMPGGEPRRMSLHDIHRRLAYARERGFRVLLYFADGLAVDSGAANYDSGTVFREPGGELRKHHWSGPDTIGQTYIMDPLHPKVRKFFHAYARAIMEEFGSDIDGLNWDETFTIRCGDISRGDHAGYADREHILLCKEVRGVVKVFNPDVALFASDCTGLALPQEDGGYWTALPAQNAIVFDGTYQDSQCYPTAWQFGLFPNYRNVLWSCNWRPVEHFEWTKLGVMTFGTPVAISNGFAENRGVSGYSVHEMEQLLDLFRQRKEQRGRVRWIECHDLDDGGE